MLFKTMTAIGLFVMFGECFAVSATGPDFGGMARKAVQKSIDSAAEKQQRAEWNQYMTASQASGKSGNDGFLTVSYPSVSLYENEPSRLLRKQAWKSAGEARSKAENSLYAGKDDGLVREKQKETEKTGEELQADRKLMMEKIRKLQEKRLEEMLEQARS